MSETIKGYKYDEVMGKDNLPISSLSVQICLEWLSEKEKKIKPISYDKYENLVKRYIRPFLDNHPIEMLDGNTIRDYLNELLDKGLSPSMVKLIKVTMKGIYCYGEKNYGLGHIDFGTINTIAEKRKNGVLSVREEKVLDDYCQSHVDSLGVSILLCLQCGLRFTEICALKVSDVDLDKGTIMVRNKVQRNVNRTATSEKTYFHTVSLDWPERREIILPDKVVQYLRLYMQDLFFDCYLLSRKVTLREQRKYQNMLRDLGLKHGFDVNYTILRNTCRKRYLKSGMDINTIMTTLGLSRIEIDIEETSSLDESYKRKEIEKLFMGL